jgi:hypothetical protein
MRLTATRFALGAVMIAVFASSQTAPAQSNDRSAPPIGAARVSLSSAQLDANGFDIRAFVSTDSSNPNCLATMAESNFAIAGISVFCSPRTFDDQQGVLVSALFPVPPPVDIELQVTLYQEQARRYGDPVLYIGQ